MRLDKIETIVNHEPLPTRLWRRYGLRAFAMLESIRRDKAMDDVLIEGAEYVRCELYQAAQTEMITTLEDFLRRRSKIALVVPRDEIKNARGIREACAILFGDDADRRYREYFEEDEPLQAVPASADVAVSAATATA
jgi:glycerol-3-phosphate dehydrogenase